jgi:hypothetical protein
MHLKYGLCWALKYQNIAGKICRYGRPDFNWFVSNRFVRINTYDRKEKSTGCPTRYRTRHLFHNSNTNEDISTKFEQEYVRL